MDYIKLYAGAKINLGLDVVGKLDNGYHELKTVMQSTKLTDLIIVRKSKISDITLKTNIPWLPTDQKNIVYKTASMLKNEYGIKEGIQINIIKKIPICAGLGGGSSDCAAALIGIRNLFKLPISNEQLLKKGKDLGSDVPFCLVRGTALAEGIGDILTPLKPLPKCFILIVKPQLNISTASIFSTLNLENIDKKQDLEKLLYYIDKEDLKGICSNMQNTLEEVTIPICQDIQNIKELMLKNNALGAMMSGSGSAVFGIWQTKKDALKAFRNIKRNKYLYNIKEIFLTTPFNNYPKTKSFF